MTVGEGYTSKHNMLDYVQFYAKREMEFDKPKRQLIIITPMRMKQTWQSLMDRVPFLKEDYKILSLREAVYEILAIRSAASLELRYVIMDEFDPKVQDSLDQAQSQIETLGHTVFRLRPGFKIAIVEN
jgi:hypothetical protein